MKANNLAMLLPLLVSMNIRAQMVELNISSEMETTIEISQVIHVMSEPVILLDKKIGFGMNSFKILIEEERFFDLQIGIYSSSVVLQPNENYDITIDAAGNYVFVKNGQVNNVLKRVDEKYKNFTFMNKFYYDWGIDEFVDGIARLRTQIDSLVVSEKAKLNVHEQELINLYVKSRFDAQILNHFWAHYPTNREESATPPAYLIRQYDNFLVNERALSLGLESYQVALKMYNYIRFVHLTKQLLIDKVTDMDLFMQILYPNIIQSDYPPKVKSFLIADLFYEIISEGPPDSFSYYLTDYIQNFPESPYYEDIIRQLTKKKQLEINEKAPSLTSLTLSGEEVELTDFYKDKVVYLDFWATWCAPCIKEMPELEKLKNDYAENQDIVFVKVSIDEEIDKWKTFELKIPNHSNDSFVLSPEFRTTVINEYLLQGVPRHIIINKQGKIVNANSPGPSSPAVREILDELVIK